MASNQNRRPLFPAPQKPLGTAGGPRPTPFWRSRGFWIYLLVLLALNYLITFVFMSGPSRITVPYTTFLAQVNADNINDITSSSVGNVGVDLRYRLEFE